MIFSVRPHSPYRPTAGTAIHSAHAFLTITLLLVAAPLTLIGYISSKMYRLLSIRHGQDYTLAFVKFDDEGELWAPPQVSRTLEAIDQANEADADRDSTV